MTTLIRAIFSFCRRYLCFMAFQIGEIKISGTIDELSFYNSVFGWLVRRKGGPGTRQFKKSPAFARSRENSSEFTLCARAASSIRKLIIQKTGIKDKALYHRLMKLMRLLANADQTSLRGQRDPLIGMHSPQGKFLLKNFTVNAELNLYTILVSAGLIKTKPSSRKARRIKPRPFHVIPGGSKRRQFHSLPKLNWMPVRAG